MSDEITTIFIHDLQDLQEERALLRAENAKLKAKLSTMVCGTCNGEGRVLHPKDLGFGTIRTAPCPVCQPKKEG